ncbi:MAG TPA: PBP1A family penicillin-binding protein, partial [Candidatus Eremiobacteraceae bacterium]|nr:PBP1A family penicillin-binding protein [Candidatus Eremiobacteraceae bacterium]
GAGALYIVGVYGRDLPDISALSDVEPGGTTRILAADGTLLARLYDRNRVYVPITQIPSVMREAIIASEDERFYSHSGVDLRGIARAAIANLQHKEIEQGASTITQQLARNLFLNSRQSLSRKIQEALLAIEIERYYTKDEILERYLNLVYFGAGAYGVQAASHAYFGEDVSHLSLAEPAMLAGLVAAPSLYNPYADMSLAKERQQHVLDRMVAVGDVTQEQADAAYAEQLHLVGASSGGIESYQYPYFTTYVIAQLEQIFGTQRVFRDGLTVYTTMDPRLEKIAQSSVTDLVKEGAQEGYGMHQGALVAIDQSNGDILAMIGGVGFSTKSQFNRAWQARRQPGSSFKGYVYSAAVDRGVPVSTIYKDSKVTYPAGDGSDYTPMDDDRRYMGPITLRTAFELSRNVVAVELAHDIGIDTVVDYANRMGVNEDLEPDLSLALGTAVVSPLEMATGYSTIASGGVYTPPTGIRYVTDKYGSIIYDARFPQRRAVLSPGTAFIMTSLMQGVINEGTGYPNAIIGRPAAGKTGTTSDFRDAWFVGFTPQMTAAVWVGNDDYSRMYESYGGNVPARIWARFMKTALAGTKPLDFPTAPPDVEVVRVCTGRNERALAGTRGYSEYFLNGTAPLAFCSGPKPRTIARATAEPVALPAVPDATAQPLLDATPVPVATSTPETDVPATPPVTGVTAPPRG